MKLHPKRGWHLSDMFEAMEHGELTTLFVLGENPADSEADRHRAVKSLSGLEFLVVQDIFYTKTAELADMVLPAAAGAFESEGTVTNSERRVQRVRRPCLLLREYATMLKLSSTWRAGLATIGAIRRRRSLE